MSQPYPPSYGMFTAPGRPGAGHQEPLFQVRVMKHFGLLIAWYNTTTTVTGTYAQCQAAITDAQRHNLALGWWSIASLLAWNWIALATNASARKNLQRQAAQAFGHPSAYPRVPAQQPYPIAG